MVNSGASNCFVCALPILNHQVGLVWQGGNGVDDFLREQMEMDIIRGRLGNTNGRRNSCAQITTIDGDTLDDLVSGNSQRNTSKSRRRSSLAQLGELLKDWGARDKDKSREKDSSHSSRRGTLADLGRNAFGKEGRSKKPLTSAASVSGPPPIEPDFMSKIRKRRETSADITVLRKGSGTVTDLKSDITRFLSQHRVSSIMGRGSDHHLEHSSECATSISSSGMCDDLGSNSSRRGSEDTQPDHKRERGDHRGPLRFFKRKESRGNMSPMTPESEIMPSFACVVRMPSTASSMDRSGSPSEADSRSEVTEVTTTTGPSSSSRRDSLKPLDRPEQFSPTSTRRAGVRRQTTTASEDLPLKSGWCSNPNLTEPSSLGPEPQIKQTTIDGSESKKTVKRNITKRMKLAKATTLGRWTSGTSAQSGGSASMTVSKIADVQEEELEEYEPENVWSKNYSQEYLYVKMTSRLSSTSSKAENYQQQGYRKSRWPTLDQLRPKLREASLTESALEDNNSSQEGQVAAAGIPKKMTTTSSSTSTPTAGDSFSGTPCLAGDNCGGTGSSSYKSRMMRGEFRVLLTA